jgi:hypothetical protein
MLYPAELRARSASRQGALSSGGGRGFQPFSAALIALMVAAWAAPVSAAPANVTVRVDTSPAGRLNVFRPDQALGAGIDGAQKGDIGRLITPHNVTAMRGLGLKPLTYRLRTELGIEAWHWTEDGTWSDPAHAQGYWLGNDRTAKPIQLSWGYHLPRRGDSTDNANNTDFSRLTDGDPTTFWKSNPYLDVRYTHEAQARPQWLQLRLEENATVDTAVIAWGEPYATDFLVQHWVGRDEYDPAGKWVTFPHGTFTGEHGGETRLRLADQPVKAQFLRVLMTRASDVAPAGSTDVRDGLGYAVREVSFGTTEADGSFHDLVRHAPAAERQTFTHVSSTDPWHRATDRDEDLEQAGIDKVFSSGLAGEQPALFPAAVMFDTPENAAALARYLKWRGYPMWGLELGEEPDGQYGDPDDYGALYLQTFDLIRNDDRSIRLGGPSLQSATTDMVLFEGDQSWNSRFVKYMKARGRLADLQFFSFEYYPFDDICGDIHKKLASQTGLLAGFVARVTREGTPRSIPWLISEYGFSAYSGRAMVETPAALLMADIVGNWLSLGGAQAYMFGYGPNVPINQHQDCAGFGNMMPYLADTDGQATDPLPEYFTARLLTDGWLQPTGEHRLLKTTTTPSTTIRSYAVRRPDGRLSVLILNTDATHDVRISLAAGKGALKGPVEVLSYGPAQYRWKPDGVHGRPDRNDPPAKKRFAKVPAAFALPASSLMVVTSAP